MELRRRAIDQITSGRELPRMETINVPLVKIVPRGSEPTGHSPFWAKKADLDAAVKECKNLSDDFALPVVSESTQYDVNKITPKAPTEVFVNTVAPTSELNGGVRKPGGARQYRMPNRLLYEPHEFVKRVDNRLHVALQKSSDHNTPHSTGARTFTNTIQGAGIAGTVYGALDGKQQIGTAIDTARSNREQWVRGNEETANQGTTAVVTGAAATVGAVLGTTSGEAAYGAEKL